MTTSTAPLRQRAIFTDGPLHEVTMPICVSSNQLLPPIALDGDGVPLPDVADDMWCYRLSASVRRHERWRYEWGCAVTLMHT